jgi:hypothetical protein
MFNLNLQIALYLCNRLSLFPAFLYWTSGAGSSTPGVSSISTPGVPHIAVHKGNHRGITLVWGAPGVLWTAGTL